MSGNSRVVRKLLIKGANKYINDKKNKSPTNIAEENEFKNIKNMLDNKSSMAEYCNIKPGFKP